LKGLLRRFPSLWEGLGEGLLAIPKRKMVRGLKARAHSFFLFSFSRRPSPQPLPKGGERTLVLLRGRQRTILERLPNYSPISWSLSFAKLIEKCFIQTLTI
jgi:hypothetical protein